MKLFFKLKPQKNKPTLTPFVQQLVYVTDYKLVKSTIKDGRAKELLILQPVYNSLVALIIVK